MHSQSYYGRNSLWVRSKATEVSHADASREALPISRVSIYRIQTVKRRLRLLANGRRTGPVWVQPRRRKSSRENRRRGLILRWRVALPQVFESFRQGLLLDGAIAVAGVLREHKLIMIVLGRELSRHEFIGDYVIVPHRVRSIKVAIAHLDPQPDRFARVLGYQV